MTAPRTFVDDLDEKQLREISKLTGLPPGVSIPQSGKDVLGNTSMKAVPPTAVEVLAKALIAAAQRPDASAVAPPVVAHSQVVHGEGPQNTGTNLFPALRSVVLDDAGGVNAEYDPQPNAARVGTRPHRSASSKNISPR